MRAGLFLSLGIAFSILAYAAVAAPERPIPPAKVDATARRGGRKGDGRFCRWLFLGHSGRI